MFGNVKDFIACEKVISVGSLEQEEQEQVMGLYCDAVKDMKDWLKTTVCQSTAELGVAKNKAVLYLPLDTVTVSVDIGSTIEESKKVPWGYQKRMDFDGEMPERYMLPIGLFDYYTCKKIMEGSNPVYDFYLHLSSLYKRLRELAGTDELLTSEMLRTKGINDLLGIHQMCDILSIGRV